MTSLALDVEGRRTILIADDEPDLRCVLRTCLENAGYAVVEAGRVQEIDAALAKEKIDLITLDLNLGAQDGLEIARAIKAKTNIPIIMITVRADEIDRVVGLEIGADDYICKPFNLREVVARVRAVLRGNARTEDSQTGQVKRIMDFYVDEAAFEVRRLSGERIELTPAEFALLEVFIAKPRLVLTREQLIQMTSGSNADSFDRSIDTLVSRLRKKLEAASDGSPPIQTVRGQGYKFVASVTPLPNRR